MRSVPSLRDEDEVEEKLKEVAGCLTAIAKEIPFTPPEIEADAPEGETLFFLFTE